MVVWSTIQQILLEHWRCDGYRRVTAELRRRGLVVNNNAWRDRSGKTICWQCSRGLFKSTSLSCQVKVAKFYSTNIYAPYATVGCSPESAGSCWVVSAEKSLKKSLTTRASRVQSNHRAGWSETLEHSPARTSRWRELLQSRSSSFVKPSTIKKQKLNSKEGAHRSYGN